MKYWDLVWFGLVTPPATVGVLRQPANPGGGFKLIKPDSHKELLVFMAAGPYLARIIV
jgi:hypothetical protein